MAYFFLAPHDKPKGNEMFQMASDQGDSFLLFSKLQQKILKNFLNFSKIQQKFSKFFIISKKNFKGNSFAQYILAVNYENGDGFAAGKNIEKAKLLFQTAADQDFEEAKQALERLKKAEEKLERIALAKSKQSKIEPTISNQNPNKK